MPTIAWARNWRHENAITGRRPACVTRSLVRARRRRVLAAAWPMYASTRSSRSSSSTVHDGSRIGPSRRTSSVLWRSVWLSSITYWSPGSGPRHGAGPIEPVVDGQELVDLAGHLHPRRRPARPGSRTPARGRPPGGTTARRSPRARPPPPSGSAGTRGGPADRGWPPARRGARNSGRFATARVSASWARWPPESVPARCLGSRSRSSMRRSGQVGVPAGVQCAPSARWSSTVRRA